MRQPNLTEERTKDGQTPPTNLQNFKFHFQKQLRCSGPYVSPTLNKSLAYMPTISENGAQMPWKMLSPSHSQSHEFSRDHNESRIWFESPVHKAGCSFGADFLLQAGSSKWLQLPRITTLAQRGKQINVQGDRGYFNHIFPPQEPELETFIASLATAQDFTHLIELLSAQRT